MAAKGAIPTYTETCTHFGAVILVREILYADGEHNRCTKCGEACKVPGSQKYYNNECKVQ